METQVRLDENYIFAHIVGPMESGKGGWETRSMGAVEARARLVGTNRIGWTLSPLASDVKGILGVSVNFKPPWNAG